MTDTEEPARRRWPRIARRTAAALVVLLVVGALVGSWYGSNEMVKPYDPANEAPELVLGVRDRVVTLTASKATTRPGAWFIVWGGASALLGDVVGQSKGRVERVILSGTAPQTGQPVTVRSTFPVDPKVSLGLDFQEISVKTELGPAPAWYVPSKAKSDARSDTWAVMVHGGNGRRQGNLHALAAIHDAGLPILDITYRNDLGAPKATDGLIHVGAQEWRDVDAAARTAMSMGAKHLVIFGGSMGGAIVGQFLTRSPLVSQVKAVVLENPMVSPPQTIDHSLRARGVPGFFSPLARWVTGRRAGVDLDQLDLMKHPPAVKPPTLVFHGDADVDIDVRITREFVAAAKRMNWPVQYEEFPGAGHTEEWNTDRVRYHDTVVKFLRSAVPAPGGPGGKLG